MKLREAVNNEIKWTKTDNGAVALKKTGSRCLDMFGRIGSMRGADEIDKLNMFDAAFKEDKDIAVKLLFYARDIRGGYGERDTFNQIFKHLAFVNKQSVINNIWAVLEFGRAKDLYCLIDTPAEKDMWEFIEAQFIIDLDNMAEGKSISLLAKWMASPDSKSENTKALGKLTAKKLGYKFEDMRDYKRKLRSLRKYLDLPEAKMCDGRWNEIEYSKCSSKFLLKNRKAFVRHDRDRWEKYIENVKSGNDKMNMGTMMPCDIIQKVFMNDYTPDLEAMWKSLPDMCNGNALVVCDTSASMWWGDRQSNKMYPGTVAYALAIYFAERNKGDLKNLFITFSSQSEFVELDGETLIQKFITLRNTKFGATTNLESAFDIVLKTAVNSKLSSKDMPDALVIISDMQIDCVEGLNCNRMTFYDSMSKKYKEAGYNMPHVVFWDVNAEKATYHASMNDAGVSLVSGYSPNIFKQVIENIGTTPYELMMKVINNERYAEIKA